MKKKGNSTRLLAIVLALLISGCLALWVSGRGEIKSKIDEKYPPLSTLDQQIKSTESTLAQLGNVENSDVILFLKGDDFSGLYKQAYDRFKNKIDSLKIEGLSDLSLENPELVLLKQSIKVSFDFGLTLKEYEIPLGGKVEGIVSINASDSKIHLRPALSQVKIDDIKWKHEKTILKKLGAEAAVTFINSFLESFLKNLNGEFLKNPLEIPLDLQFAESIKSEELIKSDKMKTTGSEINVLLQMKHLVPLIGSKGIVILGSASEITKAPVNQDVGTTTDYLYKIFARLMGLLETRLAEDFETTSLQLSKQTTFLVQKKFVAGMINSALGNLDINLQATNFVETPTKENPFSRKIRIGSASLPNCSGLRKDFNGSNCNGPCRQKSCPPCKPLKIWKADDCVARIVCEAENIVRAAGCAACKTARETEKIAHQTKNETRVAACKVKRETLRIVDDAFEVAKIKVQFKVKNSRLDAGLKKVVLTDDLSQISLTSDLSASADMWVRVWVNPESIGHLACIFQFRKTLETHASFSERNRTISAEITVESGDDNILLLKAKTDPTNLKINLSPSPYFELIKDPGFLLNCSLLNMAMPVIAGVKLLKKDTVPLQAMFGRVEYKAKSQEVEIKIKPIKIGDDQLNYELVPAWGDKVIGFYAIPK